ncbi:MAG: MFS transporter [Dehalococcoidia bacterium]
MTQFETAVATPAHPHRGVAARPSLAFGWWVVAGATLADLVATGQQQATSVLMGPMLAEMGWTRTDYSIALLLAPMVASIVALIAGGYATRRGGAGLLILGGLITAGSLESVAYSSEPWLFWLSRGVGLGAGSGLIGAAVVGGAISRWFDERRSWALTLAALGGALWMAAGTPLAQAGVDLYGWRAGWSALGGASLLLLPAAMLLRGRPLESGRDRDGYRWTGEGARDDFDAGSLDRSEATRTPTFWLLILGCALPLAGVTALSAHLVQHFADIGFTRAEAAMLVGTEGAASRSASSAGARSRIAVPP